MSKVKTEFAKQMKSLDRKGKGGKIKIHKSLHSAIESTTDEMSEIHEEVFSKLKAGIDKERARFNPKNSFG